MKKRIHSANNIDNKAQKPLDTHSCHVHIYNNGLNLLEYKRRPLSRQLEYLIRSNIESWLCIIDDWNNMVAVSSNRSYVHPFC